MTYDEYIESIIDRHQAIDSHSFEWRGVTFTLPEEVFSPMLGSSSLLLAEYLLNLDMEGWTVLDAGCGCGIQAIACGMAGAHSIHAFDISTRAVACTQENTLRAGFEDRIEARQLSTIPKFPETFDLIVCNPPFFQGNPEEGWHRSVLDQDRTLFREVVDNGTVRLTERGRLITVSGGTLTPKAIRDAILKRGFSDIRQHEHTEEGELDYCITDATK